MTYLVLARKWRPRSFETLVGQEHVVRALSHALTTQRLHHAWLFTGTRGVGKTTLSRILAKSLNCETGITATPCGVCRACTEIDAGRFVDYLELDAASNRGVDEMTQLLEQSVYSPTSGRFKVYMIDEVHMLTGHAFNAMLKTLEEPPPHVKFILATTDPQKIPVTVLSRCLQFNLKQMAPDAIVGHLDQVLQHEQMPFETAALRLIGQAARGSMRDALSLTDQAIAYSAGNLSEEAVRGMLGTIDQRHLVRLLDALGAGDGGAMVGVADELSTRSLSYAGALADLAVLLSRIGLAQRVRGTVPEDDPLAADIERLAGTLDGDQVQLFYSIAVHSRAELALAPDEYAGFVMACLRMLAFSTESAEPGSAPERATAPPRSAPLRAPSAVTAAAVPARTAGAPASSVTAPPQASQASMAPAQTRMPAETAAPDAKVSPAALALGAMRDRERAPAASAAMPERAPAGSMRAAVPENAPTESTQAAVSEGVAAGSMQTAVPESTPAASMRTAVPEARAAASTPTIAPERTASPPPASTAALAQASTPPAELAVTAQAPAVAIPPARTEPASATDSRLSPPSGSTIELTEPWAELAARLPVRGIGAQLAQQSEWTGVEGNTIVLKVATRGLAEGPAVERLRSVLEAHFGQPVRLRFVIGQTGDNTAHAVAQSDRQARQQAAEQAIKADPFVRQLLDDFGGQIVPDSIRPVTPESKQGNPS